MRRRKEVSKEKGKNKERSKVSKIRKKGGERGK